MTSKAFVLIVLATLVAGMFDYASAGQVNRQQSVLHPDLLEVLSQARADGDTTTKSGSDNSSTTPVTASCPANCHDHGVCLSSEGRCICFAAWSGDDCGVTTCPASCSGNGQCNTETGSCECFTGFFGVDCSEQGCANNCHDQGYCDQGVCQCLPGWEGVYCKDPVGCPNNCGEHGECRESHCYCDAGFTGKGCDERECPKACSGHGECNTADGKCTCLEGFLGNDCSQRRCPNDCSGTGTCDTETGKCTCNEGYYGDDCAPENCPSDCSGHGHCTQSNTTGLAACICERGWSGIGCEHELCPSLCHEDEGHGKCTPNGCMCDPKWGDVDCSRRRCPNDCTSPKNGICMPDASYQCSCFAAWTGESCDERTCQNNCNDRGSCHNGTCLCGDWWEGSLCEIPKCKNDCSGNGECIKPTADLRGLGDINDVLSDDESTPNERLAAAVGHLPPGPIEVAKCRCNDGWAGNDCSTKSCLNGCSGQGICKHGTCFCNPGFYGDDCTQVEAVPENPRNVTADEEARAVCSRSCMHGKCVFVSTVELSNLQTPNISATAQAIKASSGTYECFCEESWTGPKCTESLTACHPNCLDDDHICRKDCNVTQAACPVDNDGNACSLHGKCTRTPDDVKCECDSGWFGFNCAVRGCPNLCSGHGLCHGKTAQCLCMAGYTGVDCSKLT